MKIPRSLIGRPIWIEWEDPRFERTKVDNILRGRAALAKWSEIGWVHDVVEDVLHLRHALGADPPTADRNGDDVEICHVPLALITDWMVLRDAPDLKEAAIRGET